MANVIFNSFKQRLFTNGVSALNWTNPGTTVNVMLMGSAFDANVNADTQVFRADIAGWEIAAGGNYATGGALLPGKSSSINTATDTITLTASNVVWANSTITNARYAVLYISTGSAATDILIAAYDFGTNKSSSNDNFTFTINASGLLTIA